MSKNEAKVYLALLSHGLSTANDVAKQCGVHRTNVYDAIKGLIKKSAAASIIKNKVTFYEATDPKNLMNLLKEKELRLASILPELSIQQDTAPSGSDIRIVEGNQAIRDVLDHLLEKKKERVVYGGPKEVAKYLGEGWLKDYHERRVKMKVPMKIIYNTTATERIEFIKKQEYAEVRALPEDFNTLIATTICDDEVMIDFWSENPVIGIVIKNKKVADTYIKYFTLLWKSAKKV